MDITTRIYTPPLMKQAKRSSYNKNATHSYPFDYSQLRVVEGLAPKKHRLGTPSENPSSLVWQHYEQVPQEQQTHEKSDGCALQYQMPLASIVLGIYLHKMQLQWHIEQPWQVHNQVRQIYGGGPNGGQPHELQVLYLKSPL